MTGGTARREVCQPWAGHKTGVSSSSGSSPSARSGLSGFAPNSPTRTWADRQNPTRCGPVQRCRTSPVADVWVRSKTKGRVDAIVAFVPVVPRRGDDRGSPLSIPGVQVRDVSPRLDGLLVLSAQDQAVEPFHASRTPHPREERQVPAGRTESEIDSMDVLPSRCPLPGL